MLLSQDDAALQVLVRKAFAVLELLNSAMDTIIMLDEQSANLSELPYEVGAAGTLAEEVLDLAKELADSRRKAANRPNKVIA